MTWARWHASFLFFVFYASCCHLIHVCITHYATSIRDASDRYSKSMYGIIYTRYILKLLPGTTERCTIQQVSDRYTKTPTTTNYTKSIRRKACSYRSSYGARMICTSVLLFYMAPGTLPHVQVMTPLFIIIVIFVLRTQYVLLLYTWYARIDQV